MRNQKLLVKLFLGLAAVVLLAAGSMVRAADTKNVESVLAANDTYNGIYNRAASAVRIDGTINGNVFVAGNEISIDGTVNGDVYAAGQNISIKGKVSGTIHAAGARVDMSGEAGNSLIAAGSSVNIGADSKIGRDVLAAGSLVDIRGAVGGTVFAGGSQLNINNYIGGDVSLAAERIVIGREAKIGGNLKYNDSAQITIANDKNIAGSITKFHTSSNQKTTIASLIGKIIFGVASKFLIGLALLLLLPATIVATARYIATQAGKSALVGLGFLLITPIVTILLMITVFGLPLAVVIGLSYIVVLMTAGIFVALWLGRRITGTTGTQLKVNLWPLLLGLLIIETVKILPVIGGLIGFIVLILGVGAQVARGYDRLKQVKQKQVGTVKS